MEITSKTWMAGYINVTFKDGNTTVTAEVSRRDVERSKEVYMQYMDVAQHIHELTGDSLIDFVKEVIARSLNSTERRMLIEDLTQPEEA